MLYMGITAIQLGKQQPQSIPVPLELNCKYHGIQLAKKTKIVSYLADALNLTIVLASQC